MKQQQLLLALKFLTLTSAYLFTRSRTPSSKLKNPAISIAVLFLLGNLKRVLLHNAKLIRGAKFQVEILENDIRLLKAFLGDCARVADKDDDLEEFVELIQNVVREGEDVIVVFANQEEEIRVSNFFQRAFCGPMKLIGVAEEVRAVRAKVKSIYDDSAVFSADRRTGADAIRMRRRRR
ncbi:hypothetical protein OROMI_002998 [Orobanche minor]